MSQTQTFASAPEAAAAWWAVQIGAPTFKTISGKEPLKDRLNAGFLEMVMLGESSKHPVTAELGEAFAAALQKRIEARLNDEQRALRSVSMGVDYGPEAILADSADEVGVSCSRFPWKTHMHVYRDHVIASLGYQGAWALVWSAPDWERPSCGQHKYTDDWEPLDLVCSLPRYHEGECGQYVADPERCSVCGGTFAKHYGKSNEDWTHSYSPVVAS